MITKTLQHDKESYVSDASHAEKAFFFFKDMESYNSDTSRFFKDKKSYISVAAHEEKALLE
ncbi:hypothetical protein KQI21_03925 [Virgibacillus proomii]|nr:hypothetical protein [Virgibacillus proomii]